MEDIIGGPGGACRPQVSPDGKKLAFVKRVRAKSVLFVHDLETASLQSLAQARVGCDFHIKMLEGPACDQLRRLGFCETMQVRKLANGRNMICTVCGTRMALSRDLADQVKVSPVLA